MTPDGSLSVGDAIIRGDHVPTDALISLLTEAASKYRAAISRLSDAIQSTTILQNRAQFVGPVADLYEAMAGINMVLAAAKVADKKKWPSS